MNMPASDGIRGVSMPDWQQVADEFSFKPGLSYLNTGSEGSVPRRLQFVLAQAMAQWASDPSQAFFDNPRLDNLEKNNRARVAEFLGAPAADVVLTDNTTMGLAMVVLGLPFTPGDEIITTDQDHFSLYSPLFLLAKYHGVKVIQLSLPTPALSAESIVELFRSAITPRTRAFCFSHVTYTVGLRMPVADLCTLARANNILTLIDAAHAVGMLDLNLPALGCDFYAGAGHKWLNGPPGTGILYVRDSATNPWKLEPIVSEQAMDVGNGVTITEALQKRANLNGPAFYTLARTTDFVEAIGKPAIERRILDLSNLVKQHAVERWGPGCLFSASPAIAGEALCSGLTAFVPSRNYDMAYDQAWMQGIADTLNSKYRIWVLSTQFPAPPGSPVSNVNTLRVSTTIYNFPDDIARLFAAIDEITAENPG
jgi:selenocysteine lyase/cysteine desulfurase